MRNQLTAIWGGWGGSPLEVTKCFSLRAFKILSLSLTFVILIMICLGVGLFGFILFGILCLSWTCMSISLTKLRKFFPIGFQFLAFSLHLLVHFSLLRYPSGFLSTTCGCETSSFCVSATPTSLEVVVGLPFSSIADSSE